MRPRPPGEPLPALPVPGGPARVVLLPVDPARLHLYWIRDADLEATLGRSDGTAEIVMEREIPGGPWMAIARAAFDWRAPGWFVDLPEEAGGRQGGDRLRARLGMRRGDGFTPLLVSNTVRRARRREGTAPAVFRTLAAPVPSPTSPGVWGVGSGSAGRSDRASVENEQRGTLGYVAFILHAHLPFVRHPERDYFLEEHWLFEAMTETYLPLLDACDHLLEDGVPARLTLSLTPTLAAMLRDPILTGKYAAHLDRMCDLARREVERTRGSREFSPVAGLYHDRLERLRHLFNRVYGRDLVARVARLEEDGVLEVIGCAATHAFLPHLAIEPATVRAQIAVGVAEHRRHLGRLPRGLWLPECAWYEGLDAVLAAAGIRYVFLDTHALRDASDAPRSDVFAPIATAAGVAVFGRDAECAAQVWSSAVGYPGDPDYRDFYRDIGYDLDHAYIGPYLDPSGNRGMTGFKYHRITGRTDDKRPYSRPAALRAVQRHARDFVARRLATARRLRPAMDRPPLTVAMYDAELFGHWWFEGPEWLENVLRRLPRQALRAVTPEDYLAAHPRIQQADPSPSSWGEGGYSRVWLNDSNDWILPPLHDAGRRMTALARRFGDPSPRARRILAQAGRELLLAQASDWPFILKHGTAVDYATRRVRTHLDRFDRLARVLESRLADSRRPGSGGAPEEVAGPDDLESIEAQDNLFPDLDPGVWRTA